MQNDFRYKAERAAELLLSVVRELSTVEIQQFVSVQVEAGCCLCVSQSYSNSTTNLAKSVFSSV